MMENNFHPASHRTDEINPDKPNRLRKYYAHSLEGRPPSEWQPFEEHLKNVAAMARKFGDFFGSGDWGYLSWLWHDLEEYFIR